MAKIYGLFGSMTGKVADVVMAVRNGEQIVRKYQPVVYNPSSAAQVAQRAKMKALSQLSAILAPAIAIPRSGSVSSRNMFTKLNFKNVSFANNTAEVNIPFVQITSSVVALPNVIATNTAGTLNVSLSVPAADITRVVYTAVVREADNRLRFGGSVVVSEPGVNGIYSGSISLGSSRDAFVLAYAVRDNTDNARAVFGNLESLTATNIATLIVTRTLTEKDITLSETRGVAAFVSQQANVSPHEGVTSNRKK